MKVPCMLGKKSESNAETMKGCFAGIIVAEDVLMDGRPVTLDRMGNFGGTQSQLASSG